MKLSVKILVAFVAVTLLCCDVFFITNMLLNGRRAELVPAATGPYGFEIVAVPYSWLETTILIVVVSAHGLLGYAFYRSRSARKRA